MTDLVTKTRDQIIAEYERDYLLLCPTALTGPGTQPRLSATLLADQLMPIYANTVKAARASDIEQMSLEELRIEADRLAVPLVGATGSSGFVTITAAAGGTVITAGKELVHPSSKAVFYCVTTALYSDGQEVPIASRSTGPETNIDAGTILQWSSPPAGCGLTCTVFADSNGNGLTGGADEEGREQILEKIRDAKANPRGSGNDADYRAWALSTQGLQIEAIFIYPALYGPSTTGWTFTVPPDKYGSRIPTALQVALVRNHIASLAPRSDMGFFLNITDVPTNIVAQVEWAQDAEQWADEAPWPEYFEQVPGAGSGAVQVSGATDPLTFTLATSNGDYTTCGDPATGTTLAVWDNVNKAFCRKKVLTVVGGGPWTITCDGTFGASDTTYTPVIGQRVAPWSNSLQYLVSPTVAYFDLVGPGEAKATTYLDGSRTRRDPAPPKVWPDRITKALERDLEALSAVASLDLTEGSGVTVGPSLTPDMLSLLNLSAFPI